jgi:hypothetical protein
MDNYRSECSALENRLPLCERCQNFDLQSFARSASGIRGYLFRDVEAADDSCEFCSLLLESLKDVEKPTYFYYHFWNGTTKTNPDIYVHMTLSQNFSYISAKQGTSLPLCANRLSIEIGDRYSDVNTPSSYELCLAAEAG